MSKFEGKNMATSEVKQLIELLNCPIYLTPCANTSLYPCLHKINEFAAKKLPPQSNCIVCRTKVTEYKKDDLLVSLSTFLTSPISPLHLSENGYSSILAAFKCPIDGKPLTEASALIPCGHRVNTTALKTLVEKNCPVCKVPIQKSQNDRTIRDIAKLLFAQQELKDFLKQSSILAKKENPPQVVTRDELRELFKGSDELELSCGQGLFLRHQNPQLFSHITGILQSNSNINSERVLPLLIMQLFNSVIHPRSISFKDNPQIDYIISADFAGIFFPQNGVIKLLSFFPFHSPFPLTHLINMSTRTKIVCPASKFVEQHLKGNSLHMPPQQYLVLTELNKKDLDSVLAGESITQYIPVPANFSLTISQYDMYNDLQNNLVLYSRQGLKFELIQINKDFNSDNGAKTSPPVPTPVTAPRSSPQTIPKKRNFLELLLTPFKWLFTLVRWLFYLETH